MCQHNLPCSIVYAHCLLSGRAFASLYVLLFLEKEAEIGGREAGIFFLILHLHAGIFFRFFFICFFFQNYIFTEYHQSVNSLDPDQAQHHGLDPNCLPRLSADDKSQQERVQN